MWQKKITADHKEVVDLRTGFHIIPLIEPETGAEHKMQITIGHASCPHCGHVTPRGNLGQLDTQQLIADELEALNQSHLAMRQHATKNRVQIRKASK